MSIISEVKCARCDRKYSGVRSRCPYCGARRIGRGKYSEQADNSKGKMLIGILILSVLVIAVGVLLVTSPKPDIPDNPGVIATPPASPIMPGEDDTVTVTGINPVSPTPSPSPTPVEIQDTENPKVKSVLITYNKKAKHDFTAKVGDKTVLGVKVEPLGIEEEIIWSSSNRKVFEVVVLNTEMTQATVTGIGKGTATLTVSVGGVEDECIVRIK